MAETRPTATAAAKSTTSVQVPKKRKFHFQVCGAGLQLVLHGVENVGDVFDQRIRMHNVWRFDTVQDHIHRADDVCQRLLFFAIECPLLKRLNIPHSELLGGL